MEGLVSPKWVLSGRGTTSAITISWMAGGKVRAHHKPHIHGAEP